MFGVRKQQGTNARDGSFDNHDVAKLFFEAFSKRVDSYEAALKELSVEVGKLKISGDQSKLSDLILLERLQKTEKLLGESLNWIKQIADTVLQAPLTSPPPNRAVGEVPASLGSAMQPALNHSPIRLDPSIVRAGSLNSITTPTELQVLTLLANEGPKSAPEIGRLVGRSREHTARLMKRLYDDGYVRRDQTRIPFRYSTVERVKQSFTKHEGKDQESETVSAPQA